MLFASFVVAATLFEAGLAVPHIFSNGTTAAASSVLIPVPSTTVFDVPVPTSSAPNISEPVISCVFLSNHTATWDFNFTSSIVSVNATGVAANGTAYITATAFNSSVFATATAVVSSAFATATGFNSSIVTVVPTSTAPANGTLFPTSSAANGTLFPTSSVVVNGTLFPTSSVVANGTAYPTWTEVVNGTAFPTSTEVVNITSIWLPSFPITCFYPAATIVPNVSASDVPTLDASVSVATASSTTWY
ncbi:hypothetical protein C8Q74DRAFT_744740 [Fomes fomentarius]|nr:hypothetical protein C8Q74DRAFT_744740 [Fomes fomentarius]